MLICACTNQENILVDNVISTPITFTSYKQNNTPTRAYDNSWEINDSIGVYMKFAGEELSDTFIVDEAINVSYITTVGNGYFSPATQAIHFPEDNSYVDFIAYYPYRNLENSYIYPVDLTNQNNLSAIDLLYAANLTNISSRPNALNLAFTHQLARLSIQTIDTDGILQPLTLRLSNVVLKADFRLADGFFIIDNNSLGEVELNTEISNNKAYSQALLLPTDIPFTATLHISYGDKSYAHDIFFSALEKGKKYSFLLNLQGDFVPQEGAVYDRWEETPLITQEMLDDEDLLYIKHEMKNSMKDPVSGKTMRNYSMLYSKDLRFAYWVAYPMFPACIGSSGRTDAWNYDPYIPQSNQANLSSGFGTDKDRGHQIPSGDRTCDKETNKTTFYYSNMTPQVGQGLNQSIWAQLETRVRTVMNSCNDTVYVVTGAMPPNTGIVEREKTMAVPEYYFKALARRASNGKGYTTIAYRFYNRVYSGTNYNDYSLSVKELEAITGFTFFPHIDAATKNNVNLSDW